MTRPGRPRRPRSSRLTYALAALLAVVQVLVLAAPLGAGYALVRWRSGPGASSAPAGPSSPAVGGPGVGDSYFPGYGSSGYDVTSYQVAVTFDPGTGILSGTTTIRARATQELSSFFYDLALDTEQVLVNGAPARMERSGFADVQVTPAVPIRTGAAFAVDVRYAGEPARLPTPAGRHPWSVTGQEWTAAGEPESSTWWFPANDHPSDPALMDVSIRVPRGFQALSNGRLETADSAQEQAFDTWHWVSRQPMATYLAFLSIGHYEIEQGTADGRPFVYAVTEQLSAADRRTAFAALHKTPAVIATLSGWFGPYPFSEIGGVVPAHRLGFGGLENQTRPIYAADAILDRGFSADLVAHELTHMWFGDHVTLAQWNDVCTNECWASWGQWAHRDATGGEALDTRVDRVYRALQGNDRYWRITLADPGPDHLFDVVYTRGPMMLQSLRHRIGDEAFFGLARGWAQDPGARSLEDWMARAQAATSADLGPFFQAWVYGRVVPARTAENGFP